MIGDLANRVEAALDPKNRKNVPVCFRFSGLPLEPGHSPIVDSDYFFFNETKTMTLRYKQKKGGYSKYDYEDGKFFLITTDVNGFENFRVFNYDDLENNKFGKWLKKWSTITPEMFDIAKSEPSIKLVFAIDWVKYYNNIKKQGLKTKNVFTLDEDTERFEEANKNRGVHYNTGGKKK